MNVADLQGYAERLSDVEREALDDEGLRVHDSLLSGGYESSPNGFLAFASTGGDGVHFSIPANEAGPVIMTVPMSFDNPNLVVGSDIKEFLSLGCVYGYFSLEQLAYNWDRTVQSIGAAQERSTALQRLADQFGLRPWLAVGARLCELKSAYQIDSTGFDRPSDHSR